LSPLDSGVHKAVLFDLDGTLVDTAPDMVAVLQSLQGDHGLDPVDYEVGRSHVSNGAAGLLRLGFPDSDDELREVLRLEFLERYAHSICEHSAVFAGLDGLLGRLDDGNVPWGIVTNKPHDLTKPLLAALQLTERIACCVSGDTLSLRKPDPAPLLHACDLAGVSAGESMYVGDSSRDIEAGRAAGMATIAAAYGYITADDSAAVWGADSIAADTEELAKIVLKAVNLGP
jgi:phosphoglycolate phosphatase